MMMMRRGEAAAIPNDDVEFVKALYGLTYSDGQWKVQFYVHFAQILLIGMLLAVMALTMCSLATRLGRWCRRRVEDQGVMDLTGTKQAVTPYAVSTVPTSDSGFARNRMGTKRPVCVKKLKHILSS